MFSHSMNFESGSIRLCEIRLFSITVSCKVSEFRKVWARNPHLLRSLRGRKGAVANPGHAAPTHVLWKTLPCVWGYAWTTYIICNGADKLTSMDLATFEAEYSRYGCLNPEAPEADRRSRRTDAKHSFHVSLIETSISLMCKKREKTVKEEVRLILV